MPLIIEDGTGKATADSWISETDATAYWSDRGVAAWVEADAATREAALRNSADYLMMAYRWPGQPSFVGQRLPWPRSAVRSGSGWFPNNAIPTQVINAQMILAVEALGTNLLQKVTPERQIIEESKTLKGIGKTLKFATAPVDDLSRLRRFPTIDTILNGIVVAQGNGSYAIVPLRRVL